MPLRTYKKLRQESVKGKLRRLEFESAERRMLKQVKFVCQAKCCPECDGRAVTLHHMRLRSAGGTNDESNLLPVCPYCHDFLHANPALAAEMGLIERRNAP